MGGISPIKDYTVEPDLAFELKSLNQALEREHNLSSLDNPLISVLTVCSN